MSAKFDSGRMYTFLKGYALGADMPNTLQALVFARKAHEGQTRKSGEPYIVHPLTMACHAITLGIDDDEIVAACLLHDVVEDTDRDVSKLPVTDAVIDAVNRLTHEKGEPLEPYYRLISLNRIASVVKLLDRCDNVSTMAGVFTREKCLDYIRETRDYVLPLLRNVKDAWPQYSDLAFVLKYHIYSVIDGLDALQAGLPCGPTPSSSPPPPRPPTRGAAPTATGRRRTSSTRSSTSSGASPVPTPCPASTSPTARTGGIRSKAAGPSSSPPTGPGPSPPSASPTRTCTKVSSTAPTSTMRTSSGKPACSTAATWASTPMSSSGSPATHARTRRNGPPTEARLKTPRAHTSSRKGMTAMEPLSMYLLDLQSERMFPVTALRTDTEHRVLNCSIVFHRSPIAPSDVEDDPSPDLRAYRELNKPESSWFLCEREKDACRLLHRPVPDVRYLFRDMPEFTSVIPVSVEKRESDDGHGAISLFLVMGPVLDTDCDQDDGKGPDPFVKVYYRFLMGTQVDADGNPYHCPFITDDPEPIGKLRLYDDLDAVRQAALRAQAIRTINETVGQVDRFDTDQLQTLAGILSGDIPLPQAPDEPVAGDEP